MPPIGMEEKPVKPVFRDYPFGAAKQIGRKKNSDIKQERFMSDHAKISRFLSYVLRHEPHAIGLSLDGQGWAAVDELIGKAQASGTPLDRETLFEIVSTSDKKRFTLSEDRHFIRAAQGHSVEVDLGLPPVPPPDALFHGTAMRFLESILAEGLRPGSRRKVHLSADEATALKVGMRHGKPVVLKVDSASMAKDGLAFWQAENGVWLTDAVPAKYLRQ